MEGTPFDTEYAKSLYDLHSHELLWDTLTDTKALVAWSDTRILVAFAGTKSMANVMTDLKVRSWWAYCGGDGLTWGSICSLHLLGVLCSA